MDAIKLFEPAPGFKVELFAAEPLVANPVAFTIDNKGRFFVVETFRLHAGVTDIRGHMDWLDEDLANRTTDDRLAMMRRHLGSQFPEYSQQSDRVVMIEDTKGQGRGDRMTVFADGFNHPLDGLAAGVLARGSQVWVTDLPNLWSFRDRNGDGVADERLSLSYGYGVRVGFLGHDLHGLRFGPDGKIYFSIGDRGSSVHSLGKVIGDPDTGCVFRCNRDGSELEVFATGLRNPQGLAFDEFGNLFTGDNNSDGGDQARWVYLIEGGDSGWRVGFQFLDFPNSRGPWNSEKMWHPRWEGQAAFLVPPILNIGNGPSGIAHYPGTGMPERYKGHFFMTDFKGGKGSGIHSFALKPAGATFEMTDQHKLIWECLPTDVNFGIDGGLYYTDWVHGWNMTGKGRIYHVYEPESATNRLALETRRILLEGLEKRSARELAGLLAHPDMRVRQEAQFELAGRGQKSIPAFAQVAASSPNTLARLHAIWGLGQLAAEWKKDPSREEVHPAMAAVLPLLRAKDLEVRAQAAKVLGDHCVRKAGEALVALLADSSARVRSLAAISLGKLGYHAAAPALAELLRGNTGGDPCVRHGAVMGLLGTATFEDLQRFAQDASPSVRMGVLLAMRRLGRAEIAGFLEDKDPLIVTEAARAINDLPISGAMEDLASLLSRSGLSEPALRRALNANFRVGLKGNAQALATFAADGSRSAVLRREALMDLADWPKPSGRDRVTGLWRPTAAARNTAIPSAALEQAHAAILEQAPAPVQIAALRALASLQVKKSAPAVKALFEKKEASGVVRLEALRALSSWRDESLAALIAAAASDPSEEVRREALTLQAAAGASGAIAPLAAAVRSGSIGEKQSAFAALATLKDPAADQILIQALDKLKAGRLPKEVELDLLEAAAKRTNAAVKEALAPLEKVDPNDPLRTYQSSLYGGVAEEGKKIFFERAEAACVRCHKINGEGGEVGPDLSKVGATKERAYILESVLLPNKQIAAGFESLIVRTKSGIAYAGVTKSENAKELVLNSPEDGIVTVQKSDITGRERGISAMPEGLGNILTREDLRNLIEYLANLK